MDNKKNKTEVQEMEREKMELLYGMWAQAPLQEKNKRPGPGAAAGRGMRVSPGLEAGVTLLIFF